MTLSTSQPDSNLVIALSLQPDLVFGTGYLLNSKPSLTLVFLGANLNLFFIFVSIPLAHTNSDLGYRSIVGGNIDSVLLLLWSPYVIGQTIIFSSCFMVALCNRADHIYFHPVSFFFFFFLLLFFPRLISAVGDWMSTILRHMVWS